MQTPIVYVGEEIKWEYKIVTDTPSLETLNELGADGWQLAAILPTDARVTFYFKREK